MTRLTTRRRWSAAASHAASAQPPTSSSGRSETIPDTRSSSCGPPCLRNDTSGYSSRSSWPGGLVSIRQGAMNFVANRVGHHATPLPAVLAVLQVARMDPQRRNWLPDLGTGEALIPKCQSGVESALALGGHDDGSQRSQRSRIPQCSRRPLQPVPVGHLTPRPDSGQPRILRSRPNLALKPLPSTRNRRYHAPQPTGDSIQPTISQFVGFTHERLKWVIHLI